MVRWVVYRVFIVVNSCVFIQIVVASIVHWVIKVEQVRIHALVSPLRVTSLASRVLEPTLIMLFILFFITPLIITKLFEVLSRFSFRALILLYVLSFTMLLFLSVFLLLLLLLLLLFQFLPLFPSKIFFLLLFLLILLLLARLLPCFSLSLLRSLSALLGFFLLILFFKFSLSAARMLESFITTWLFLLFFLLISFPSVASRMLEFVIIFMGFKFKQTLLLIPLLPIKHFLFFLLCAISSPFFPLIFLQLLFPLILLLLFSGLFVGFPLLELIVGLKVGFRLFLLHPSHIFQTSFVQLFIIL